MSEENDGVEIVQESEYSQKTDFSKGEVVRNQVAKCCEIRSKELKEGYFNYDKLGNRIYIPDARREYVSAVKALKNLLSPEIARSKTFKKRTEELAKKEIELFYKWAVYPEAISGSEIVSDKTRELYIPELDEVFPIRKTIAGDHYGSPGRIVVEVCAGKYNTCFHGYWNALAQLYDKWFAELNILIDQNNYFKKGRMF